MAGGIGRFASRKSNIEATSNSSSTLESNIDDNQITNHQVTDNNINSNETGENESTIETFSSFDDRPMTSGSNTFESLHVDFHNHEGLEDGDVDALLMDGNDVSDFMNHNDDNHYDSTFFHHDHDSTTIMDTNDDNDVNIDSIQTNSDDGFNGNKEENTQADLSNKDIDNGQEINHDNIKTSFSSSQQEEQMLPSGFLKRNEISSIISKFRRNKEIQIDASSDDKLKNTPKDQPILDDKDTRVSFDSPSTTMNGSNNDPSSSVMKLDINCNEVKDNQKRVEQMETTTNAEDDIIEDFIKGSEHSDGTKNFENTDERTTSATIGIDSSNINVGARSFIGNQENLDSDKHTDNQSNLSNVKEHMENDEIKALEPKTVSCIEGRDDLTNAVEELLDIPEVCVTNNSNESTDSINTIDDRITSNQVQDSNAITFSSNEERDSNVHNTNQFSGTSTESLGSDKSILIASQAESQQLGINATSQCSLMKSLDTSTNHVKNTKRSNPFGNQSQTSKPNKMPFKHTRKVDEANALQSMSDPTSVDLGGLTKQMDPVTPSPTVLKRINVNQSVSDLDNLIPRRSEEDINITTPSPIHADRSCKNKELEKMNFDELLSMFQSDLLESTDVRNRCDNQLVDLRVKLCVSENLALRLHGCFDDILEDIEGVMSGK